MYKKRYLVADAAAAFRYIRFHFQLHLFSTSAARESGSGHPMGGSSRQGAKINYLRFNPYALSISHSPPTMSLMQSGYTCRERERKNRRKNTSQHRGDSFGTAGGLLGYHSLIAAVARDVEWPGK